MNKEWFASWFDSPYYHILYQDRDEAEAHVFIKNLHDVLALPEKAEVLDLACGKGRHSITLHRLGYMVTGADLSPSSIEEAQQMSSDGLSFVVQDMRESIPGKKFHAIFNLFTSFGYFENPEDNHRVLQSIHEMLYDSGLLVIDFMNVEKVLSNLIPEEHKIHKGIEFTIRKEHKDGFIVKEIAFDEEGITHHFTEKVRALRVEDFTDLLEKNDFHMLNLFGDIKLSTFDPVHSERLIIIAQKK